MVGWGVSDFLSDVRFDPRTKTLIRILENVSDADLLRLYQNAFITVFPSLYEGWGLPVAESLAAGKFCISSNAASLPEVGGTLIDYLEPWDVSVWVSRLAWYIEHPAEIKQKESVIRASYKVVSWKETSESIMQSANKLLV
jgi:glycosyltransferase involved in cell wall biosynthesis